MKLKLKAVALFSLAFWTDHYFLIDIDRGIFVDTISYGDFGISMIPAAFSLALSLALAVLNIHCSSLPPFSGACVVWTHLPVCERTFPSQY